MYLREKYYLTLLIEKKQIMETKNKSLSVEEALYQLSRGIDQLNERLLKFIKKDISAISLLDNADLKQMLHCIDSTPYRQRKRNIIPKIHIGRKIYCPRSFIEQLIKASQL
ncbi:hypothetical protein [Soonwooa sp.]|uniref:hypothetical protein n=1 Tax=Soonwooa sp. TaxID=1938592 RepID=UPI0028ACD517|nr:hypothetical protein [Soonwooa sp.]